MKILTLNKTSEIVISDELVKITNSKPISTKGNSSASTQFLCSLPSLIADGVFEYSQDDLIADIDQLLLLEERENDPLEYIFDWAPFQLSVESTGTLGFDDFRFIVRFKNGKRVISVKYSLIFAWRSSSTIYRLPASYAKAIKIISDFNSSDSVKRDKHFALDSLYQLKKLSSFGSPIIFDEHLDPVDVIKPENIQLGVIDDGSSVIAYPKIDGVDEEELKKHFLNSTEVKKDYDLSTKGKIGRKRVILSYSVEKVFKSIKNNAFALSGKAREDFYRSPRSILPEGGDVDPEIIQIISEAGFGPRVKGIGFPSFVKPINSISKENWFDKDKTVPKDTNASYEPVNFVCEYPDGESKEISLETIEIFNNFKSAAKSALARGNTSFNWNDDNIPITDGMISYLDSLSTNNNKENAGNKEEKYSAKRLLIHTNEDEIDYSEFINRKDFNLEFQAPNSLKNNFGGLKPHQVDGISWLERLLAGDLSKGGLLADDMGLGKTVQVLTFLAWCIETELKSELGKISGPYDPILIVAPLMLVENWKNEIESYFDSSVFMPLDILHGSALTKYKKKNDESDASNIDKASLDIEKLRSNRLLITNYDTVKNYQCSFAKLPISIVVVDEAQEIKEPNTATTYALKALNPIFRVASTGTPIETSLSNLWSIMDFVQPGNSLGTLKEFNRAYTQKEFDDASIGEGLRNALGYNSKNGLVLRRSKKDVLKDLPPKHMIEVPCFVDDEFLKKYKSILKNVSTGERKGTDSLQALHKIASLSQHPFLIEGQPFRDSIHEYLKASPKLSETIRILKEIKSKKEKVLIFTRSRVMQDILKAVIDETFSLDVSIVNGETASRHKYVNNTRSGIVSRFSSSDGFDILILSPEVAGVGLTITSANHVIHYGRWWNPAKENQATDRVYRIGQKKQVYVYHLLLKDKTGEVETFDEKLHRLLKSREELADNFFIANGSEAEIQKGLLNNLFETEKSTAPAGDVQPIKLEIIRYSPFQFEALVALLFKDRFKAGEVFVTCKNGDRGVDVIGINPNEILLIQVKMTNSEGFCSKDAMSEVIDGLDFYRDSIFPKELKKIPVKLAVVTTGKFDKEFKKEAREKSIEIYDNNEIDSLYKESDISLFAVEAEDRSRPKSIEDVKDKISLISKRISKS